MPTMAFAPLSIPDRKVIQAMGYTNAQIRHHGETPICAFVFVQPAAVTDTPKHYTENERSLHGDIRVRSSS